MRRQYCHAVDIVPTLLRGRWTSRCQTSVNGYTQHPLEGVSFTATFDDAEATTAKETQFFSMLGVRAGDLQSKRVEACLEMTADAIGADQHQGAERSDGGGAHLLAGVQHRRRPRVRAFGGGTLHLWLQFRMTWRPGGAGRLLQHRARVVVQCAK